MLIQTQVCTLKNFKFKKDFFFQNSVSIHINIVNVMNKVLRDLYAFIGYIPKFNRNSLSLTFRKANFKALEDHIISKKESEKILEDIQVKKLKILCRCKNILVLKFLNNCHYNQIVCCIVLYSTIVDVAIIIILIIDFHLNHQNPRIINPYVIISRGKRDKVHVCGL